MEAHLKSARQARKRVERIRRELLDAPPQCLENCLLEVQNAIACMEDLAAGLAHDRASISLGDIRSTTRVVSAADEQPLRAELLQLRRDLAGVGALLDNAARFYAGYAGLLGVNAPSRGVDYSPAGRVPTEQAFAHGGRQTERLFLVHG